MTGSTLRPGEIVAGYRIKRLLGAGGMGEVYLARDRDLPRDIALKLLSRTAEGDPQVRRRFQREADIVAQLNHPNIVTVHARGDEQGRLWIAMGYVNGTDLAAALRGGALDINRAVRILAEAAAALDCAHDAGVLHRDVKPANVLLTAQSPERVVLTDFGIAKIRGENTTLTRTGDVLASFSYAAPERLDSGTVDDRHGDVYSLGCTFFHMLTGNPPYLGSSVAQLMRAHLFAPIPTASTRMDTIPAALDEVFARALAKNPTDRFDTCRQLACAVADAFTTPGRTTQAPTQRHVSPVASAPRADWVSAPELPASEPGRATAGRRKWRRLQWLGVALVATIASVVSYLLVADGSGQAGALTETAAFTVGQFPQGVVLNPSVHTGYVANQLSNTVSVFNTDTHTVTATIPIAGGPTGMAIDTTDHILCVTSWISQTVSVIDTASNRVTATIPVGKAPIGIAFDSALGIRPTAFVTNTNGDTISVIDTHSNTVTATIAVENPWQIAIDPTTHTGYVTNNLGATVSVIDTATNTLSATIGVGERPVAVAVDPVTHTAYVTNAVSNTVSVIDTRTNIVTATIAVGEAPGSVAIDPTTDTVYVGNHGGNTVSVIDTGTHAVVATIPVGEAPGHVVVDPITRDVYVALGGGTVSVLTY